MVAYAHKLIDGSDLHHFADRRPREAQGLLPDIIRRLLEETPGVEGLMAPGGDGVITRGWDICVDNAPGSPYVPAKQSRWELGTSSDPSGKATQDYTNRTSRPDQQGVNPSETVLVFVSMRRWVTKITWRDRRRAEGIWRGIEVKDADDIFDWLSTNPTVHRSVTEMIRRSIDGTAYTPPAQIPRDVPDFVGRRDSLNALLDAAIRANAVVIAGQPGVGKTALAVRFAHSRCADYPDGQIYVDLRGTHADAASPDAVMADLLRALGAEDSLDRGIDEQFRLYRSLCHDKRLLIVLDNAADEGQVRPLLPAGSGCLALVTSRSSLSGLDAVGHIQLDTLRPREALDMLAAITSPERISAEYPSAALICELCGFLPLALRIAGTLATKRRGWSLNNLAQRLSDEHRRLDQLTAGDVAVRASFHLSYRRLHPDTQLVFRRIPLVPGPDFNLDLISIATEKECDTDLDDQLELLAELNLISYGRRDGRYAIHDLLRLYAEETLNSTDSRIRTGVVSKKIVTYLLETASKLSFDINSNLPAHRDGTYLQESLL
ncbi:ATP-binding protein [Amycolatopsis sp. WGS_07]|uniref:ATP-binding protein n=1 Tax=Amycolatopsis sp. WGS_07 TaxID=3076764 RepID=UPI0038735DB2